MSRSSHQLFIASLGIASLVACQSEIPRPFVGQVTAADASVGGAFDASVRGAPETSDPYADQVKPKVALDDTAAITTAAAVLTISGQAVDNVGVTAVMIRAGVNVPRPVSFQFDSGAFAIPVQLAVGVQVIEVTAYDAAGNIGTATRSVTRTVTKKDTAPPKLVVSTPKSGFEVHGSSIAVKGTASDDVALASVTVQVGTAAAKTAETSDNFANWWLQAKLLTGSQQTLTVRATDLAGKSAQVVIVGSTTNVVDIEPPFVTVQAPADGHKTASDSVLVKGIAKDASGIASVEIRVGGGPYQPALSNDGFMHFQRVVVLAPGANVIRVRVRDNSGLQTLVKRTVHNTSIDQWGMPKVVTLGYKAALYNSSAFTLDKAGVKSLFPPDKAAQIELMQLDVSTLMQNTLKQLRDACGKGWNKKNSLDKNCPKDWGLAEVNLWRLLTMTPNNVNVAGTSIEGVKEMATTLSSWGLLDSFDEVLALGLGIGKYDLIVAEKPVAEAMVATIIAAGQISQPRRWFNALPMVKRFTPT